MKQSAKWELGALIIVPPSVGLWKQQAGTRPWTSQPLWPPTFKQFQCGLLISLLHLSLDHEDQTSASPTSPASPASHKALL